MTTLLWIAGFLFAGYALGALVWATYALSRGFPLGAALYVGLFWPVDAPESFRN